MPPLAFFFVCVCAHFHRTCVSGKQKLCACVRVGALALNSWPRHSGLQFSPSSRFSIVNEEDRRERGLLVLIYPGGSLGITINSQLRAHSTGLHRHCQFVPIREPSFWVSAVRGCSGPTGEQPVRPWLRTWPHWAWVMKRAGFDLLLNVARHAQLNICYMFFFPLPSFQIFFRKRKTTISVFFFLNKCNRPEM